ncbi:MAG TPA: ABC transporter ATP-binding protein [Candidatus Saccharimonadales bacterium]|nr:ABC transporter ATP-binding protein [Candidatus Saccharimonadales bacterium]
MNGLVQIHKLRVHRGVNFSLSIDCLSLTAGKTICLAGPNGSGKSTLIQSIAGLITPDQGTITVAGQAVSSNLRATRAAIGLIPDDEDWLIKELCAKEYFALLARVYRDAGVRTDMEAQALSLSRELMFNSFLQPLDSLSHGNKKKVQIIAGLMHHPALLVLDEVRNGLDPLAIIAVESLLKREKSRGACILAATHDLWWAQRTGDRIILLSQGKVQADKSTSSIKRTHKSVEAMFMELNGLQTG